MPSPDRRRPPLEPALDFLQHLWQLNHALERMSLQMARRLGVTAQQRLMVRCIGKYPGLTGSQLADLLHLDRGTISVGLRRLAARGLITQRRDDRDNRRVSLGLTAKGRGIDRPDEGTVEAAVERLLARVGSPSAAVAKRVLLELATELTQRLERERGARR